MSLRQGDRVLVNVAPFIGSARRSKESVPCAICAIAEDRIQVSPEAPYRRVVLWVDRDWVDRKLDAEPACTSELGMQA